MFWRLSTPPCSHAGIVGDRDRRHGPLRGGKLLLLKPPTPLRFSGPAVLLAQIFVCSQTFLLCPMGIRSIAVTLAVWKDTTFLTLAIASTNRLYRALNVGEGFARSVLGLRVESAWCVSIHASLRQRSPSQPVSGLVE